MITAAAAELYDPEAERLHGRPGRPDELVELHLCRWHGVGDVMLTENEAEEFEEDTHITLDSDVLTLRQWKRLLRWLHKNHQLTY